MFFYHGVVSSSLKAKGRRSPRRPFLCLDCPAFSSVQQLASRGKYNGPEVIEVGVVRVLEKQVSELRIVSRGRVSLSRRGFRGNYRF